VGKSHGGDGYVGQTEGLAFLPPLTEQIAGEFSDLPGNGIEFETSQEFLGFDFLAGAQAHVQFGDVRGATSQQDILLGKLGEKHGAAVSVIQGVDQDA
jgi:hypothetical protein